MNTQTIYECYCSECGITLEKPIPTWTDKQFEDWFCSDSIGGDDIKCYKCRIPDKMPYTFQDILACKDISEEDIKRDWENLCKFDALSNPRKFCGNPIIYKYQFENLLKCRRGTKGYKTLEEWFSDDKLKDELWKLAVHINRRDKAPYPSPTDVYECHRKCKGSIVAFKASTAKYIYKLFGAENVLDPTAGWGGRMLGAMSLGISYTGIDTNVNMKEAYFNMMKVGNPWSLSDGDRLGKIALYNGNYKMEMIWKSCFDVDFSKGDYDLVLTSPPYDNMEIYEHSELYDNENNKYYEDFLIPLMNKLHDETDCPICINISPKIYKTLTEKYNYPECDKQIDLRQQMGKQYKTKSQDYIYVWRC